MADEGAPQFDAAWRIARVGVQQSEGTPEPTERQIARYLARDPTLRYIAGLHQWPVDTDGVLAVRHNGLRRERDGH